jgi:hypothetical protein
VQARVEAARGQGAGEGDAEQAARLPEGGQRAGAGAVGAGQHEAGHRRDEQPEPAAQQDLLRQQGRVAGALAGPQRPGAAGGHDGQAGEDCAGRADRRADPAADQVGGQEMAQAIEALLAIAPRQAVTGLTGVTRGKALQRARTCYDHLAGQLGVALADALEQQRVLTPAAGGWVLTSQGERRLGALGLDIGALRRSRRSFLRPCLDWTERRPHVAGMLGRVLAGRLLDLGWVRRAEATRAVLITPLGEQQLLAEFAVRV